METLHFYKYHGTGNDFIIFDGRKRNLSEVLTEKVIAEICHRRFGIGADGIMILEEHDELDFNMVYVNADGKPSSMCGNGGRCLVAFANMMGTIDDQCTFMATDGPHEAVIRDGIVELKMIDVQDLEYQDQDCILNTGSPHYIINRTNLNNLDIISDAHAIRNNDRFKEEGINVNFIQEIGYGLRLRTYERGVEGETLACGTGATAAAIAYVDQNNLIGRQDIPVLVEGGKLSIKLQKTENGYEDIWLCGPAEFVFEGNLLIND